MQYSLLSRFRGALLGAMLGYHRAADFLEGRAFGAGKGMIALLRHLTEHGPNRIPWSALHNLVSPDNPADSRLGLAVATLPLALYCHDRETQLIAHLQAAATAWNLPPEAILPAHLWAEGLALALLETLDWNRLPLQLLENLDIPSDTVAAHQLRQVQVAYEERYSWAIALHHLQHLSTNSSDALPLPLLLALYGFLRSPTDMPLALALPAHEGAAITGVFVGAIAGSCHGTVHLPTHSWPDSVTLLSTWDVSHIQDVALFSDYLLAQWAGVYRPLSPTAQSLKGTIVAPRPSHFL